MKSIKNSTSNDEYRKDYRLHYCGTCKTMGKKYGQRTRVLLNHDVVFLGQLLSAFDNEEQDKKQWDSQYFVKKCFALPKKAEKFNVNILLSCLAIIGVLACQSRTGFIALLVLMISYVIYCRIGWKYILLYGGLILIGFWTLKFEGNSYLGSLGDSELVTSAKLGRMDQWKAILATMPDHWFLGHGVNKAFFEKNGIHAESEYFLILYRYGIAGLIAFVFFWLSIFIKGIKSKPGRGSVLLFGTLIIAVVTGLTNNPFHSTKLSVFIIFALGVGLSMLNEQKKV